MLEEIEIGVGAVNNVVQLDVRENLDVCVLLTDVLQGQIIS